MMSLAEIAERGRAINDLLQEALRAETTLVEAMHAYRSAMDEDAMEGVLESDEWADAIGAVIDLGRSCPECLEVMERGGCGCGYEPSPYWSNSAP